MLTWCFIIDSVRKDTDKIVNDIFNQNGNDTDDANAFRHAYWSALVTEKIGDKLSKIFLDAHEFGWGEVNAKFPIAMEMDLHNNAY